MEYAFAVSRVTCSKCVATVQKVVGGVSGVTVDSMTVYPPRLAITSDASVDRHALNQLLASEGPYRLWPTYLMPWIRLRRVGRKFRPLILMASIVILLTVLYELYFGYSFHTAMYALMGMYFLVFGSLKVANWKKFPEAYRAYDEFARISKAYAYAYPAIEIGLAVLFLTQTALPFAAITTAILMIEKAYSVRKKLRTGEKITCACLGGFFSIPITWVTFFEDGLMAVMALSMIPFLH